MSGAIKLNVSAVAGTQHINGFVVYKSSTPFTVDTLPEPYYIETGGNREFYDYDVVEGNTYYYCIQVSKEPINSYTDVLTIVASAAAKPLTFMRFRPTNTKGIDVYEFSLEGEHKLVARGHTFGNAPTILSTSVTGDTILHETGTSKIHCVSSSGALKWTYVGIGLTAKGYHDNGGNFWALQGTYIIKLSPTGELLFEDNILQPSIILGCSLENKPYFLKNGDVTILNPDGTVYSFHDNAVHPSSTHGFVAKDGSFTATYASTSTSTAYFVGKDGESLGVISRNYFNNITELSNGDIAIGSNAGLYIYDKDTYELKTGHNVADSVSSVLSYDDDTVLIKCNGRITKTLTLSTGIFYTIPNNNTAPGNSMTMLYPYQSSLMGLTPK